MWLNDADTTALSVGGAEYYAVDMGRAVALMLRSLHADVRIDMVSGRKGQLNSKKSFRTCWAESEENKLTHHVSRDIRTSAGRSLTSDNAARRRRGTEARRRTFTPEISQSRGSHVHFNKMTVGHPPQSCGLWIQRCDEARRAEDAARQAENVCKNDIEKFSGLKRCR